MNTRKRRQTPETTPETDDGMGPTRAHKRARLTVSPDPPSHHSTENAPDSTCERVKRDSTALKTIPQSDLLLMIPALLLTPPNHPDYPRSLHCSLVAARECVALPALEVDVECRAWRNLAEVGMRIVEAGYAGNKNTEPVYDWAVGIEPEVEKAISKALVMAQKHSSLSQYRYHLTLLSARFAQWQHNYKFATSLLKRLLTSQIKPSTPPTDVYNAHLFYISLLLHQNTKLTQAQVVSAISALEAEAKTRQHPYIGLLARYLHLRTLVQMGAWDDVKTLANQLEETFGFAAYYPAPATKDKDKATTIPPTPAYPDPFVACIAAHVLILVTLYYTHLGDATEATKRLGCLHALVDARGEDMASNGSLEVSLSSSFSLTEQGPREKGDQSLIILSTHARIINLLVYLVSAITKRDPVGRKPRRKVFAEEGMAVCTKVFENGIEFLPWAGTGQVQEMEERVARIKADLMCEMIGVCIMRSEFDIVDKTFNELVAHTRAHNLFDEYAPRITLFHAHVAQAVGDTQRAMRCYRIVASIASTADEFVRVSALAGEVMLLLGLRAMKKKNFDDEDGAATEAAEGEEDNDEDGEGEEDEGEEREEKEKREMEMIERKAGHVVKLCHSLGGTMKAVAEVIQACLCKELVKARSHLKLALAITSDSQDNYLRALILALIAAYFFHTSEDHTINMLNACDNLASGLGAQEKSKSKPSKAGHQQSSSSSSSNSSSVSLGHARLRLWIGQTVLELHRRAGEDALVEKQEVLIRRLEEQVKRVEARRVLFRAPALVRQV